MPGLQARQSVLRVRLLQLLLMVVGVDVLGVLASCVERGERGVVVLIRTCGSS